jgi:hypothetical protein
MTIKDQKQHAAAIRPGRNLPTSAAKRQPQRQMGLACAVPVPTEAIEMLLFGAGYYDEQLRSSVSAGEVLEMRADKPSP